MNNQPVTDGDILQLIVGDELAFTSVYKLYGAKVYRVAFRFLKDKEQSEEIVQETFISLWLSREKLDANGNLWLYLYVIAKRLSLNALRQVSKSTTLVENLIRNAVEFHNDTEEDILANDLEQFTGRILSTLPQRQQMIFKLSRIDGLSHKEIAEQLHISPNTVKNHMVDALKTLRAHFQYSDFLYLIVLIHWI